jgi:hypothetical protein
MMKKIKTLAGNAKKKSNLVTLVLIAYMAYTFSEWHSIASLDRFINLLIVTLIMAVNIKFYLIYSNLGSIDDEVAKASIERTYIYEKREYNNLVRISLWMGIVILIGKLFLS